MSVMKRLQKYIKIKKNKLHRINQPEVAPRIKKETKPVKRKGQAKASKLRSRYNPSTDQWIKQTN